MDGSFDDRLESMHTHLKIHLNKLGQVYVAIYDQSTDMLKTSATSTAEGHSRFLQDKAKLSDITSLRYIAEHKQPRVIDNLKISQHPDSENYRKLRLAGYASSYTSPLWFNNQLIGFLFCDALESYYFDEYVQSELSSYSQILSRIIAMEFMTIKMLGSALATALEFSRYRDEETTNHLLRMSSYSRTIAKAMASTHSLTDEDIEFIYRFSSLHDIGKIAIPDAILRKPGKLTTEEFDVMKTHTIKGEAMISKMLREFNLDGIYHTDMLKNIVAYHHECFDGTGYPEGLAGDAIPLEARIVAVADVFDALSSERSYKRAWSFDEAFAYLVENAGRHFDPDCVAAAIESRSAFNTIYLQYQDIYSAFVYNSVDKNKH
ncbi:HD domain-containing phosphohydrolase [Aeromonas fluvialis]|uniref:HD domain-containing phosphohydrolase n=1 Tax=Aeromonas fluvialis TaxID=591962 RepID=UPI0005AA2F37|nr:HD domain-containing phosphohydrolase [Aeromonas fluvialis]